MKKPCKKALARLAKAIKDDAYKLCIDYNICPLCGEDLLGAGFLRSYCNKCKVDHREDH